jgi:hypothetical protein
LDERGEEPTSIGGGVLGHPEDLSKDRLSEFTSRFIHNPTKSIPPLAFAQIDNVSHTAGTEFEQRLVRDWSLIGEDGDRRGTGALGNELLYVAAGMPSRDRRGKQKYRSSVFSDGVNGFGNRLHMEPAECSFGYTVDDFLNRMLEERHDHD